LSDLSVEFQAVRPLWLILLPAAALLVVWWTYRRTYPPVGGGYRLLLLGLRVAVVALAGLLLFEPVVSLTRQRSRPERIALLVDRSASMMLPADGQGEGMDRREAALQVIARLTGDTPGTGREKKLFAFGEELTPVDSPGALFTVVEDRTDLHAALEGLLSMGAGWDRILLISDGRINSGADPADAFESAGNSLPVLETVVTGEPPARPDLALLGLERLGGRVFAGGEIELEISLGVHWPPSVGPQAENAAATAVAEIFLDERKVAEKRIPLEAGLSRFVSSRVSLEAGEPGLKLLRAALRPLKGEWTELNNERLLFVEVARSKREILLMSNKPDWDFSFLRQAVAANEEFSVKSVIVLRSAEAGEFIRRLDASGVYSDGSYPSARELEETELVLVHGKLSAYDNGFLARLASRAAEGGLGLIFWPAGELAPAALPRALAGCLPFKGRLPDNFRQVPGSRQPVTVLTLDRYNILVGLGIGEPLNDLPPLEWIFPEAPLKAGAEVLARVNPGKPRDAARGPALVVQPVQQTRVATVLGRGLWRWHMLGQSSDKKKDTSYYRMWDKLVEWLISGRKSAEFTLEPRRPVFTSGERVLLDGRFQQSEDRALDQDTGQTVRVFVFRQGEPQDTLAATEVIPAGGDLEFSVELGRLTSGLYSYEGLSSGRKAAGRFAVEKYSPELAEILPDTAIPAGLSRRTGGSIAAGGDFESPAGGGRTVEPEVSTYHPATSAWVYLLLIALLAAEWALRRRKSLA